MSRSDDAEQAEFAAEPSSVRDVRRLVRDVLERWEHASCDTAELLVSELATNAVIHARSRYTVSVRRLSGDGIRVEVADASPATPVRRHYSETSGTGRGLGLVEDLAASWGIDRTPAGKRVWFVLDGTASENEPERDLVVTDDSGDVDLDAVLAGLGASEPADADAIRDLAA